MSARLFERGEEVTRFGTRRITLLAALVAFALVVTFIESLLPPPIPIAPGAKLGLGNISALIALIVLGVGDAYIVALAKCLLGALITGSVSGLMYSVPSAVVSVAVEAALMVFVGKISVATVSLVGAATFNVMQLIVACFVTSVNMYALLPAMLAASLLFGAFTGLLTYYIIKKIPYSVYGRQKGDRT